MDNSELKELNLIQKEGLKLMRHSKGYSWEVRLLEINVDRLEEINKKLLEKFGVRR